ncbi:MAG: hypothetical protein WCP79_00730 [Bacillota bacterium]
MRLTRLILTGILLMLFCFVPVAGAEDSGTDSIVDSILRPNAGADYASFAANEPPALAASQDKLFWGETANSDGTIVRIPITNTNLDKVQLALDALSADSRLQNVKVLLSQASAISCVVVMGDSSAVEVAKKIIGIVLKEQLQAPKYMIDIQVHMRSYSASELKSLGINIFPTFTNNNYTVGDAYSNSGSAGKLDSATNTITGTFSSSFNISDININDTLNSGQTLVTGEVLAASGATAMISNQNSFPIIITSGGNTSTSTQQLNSQLQILPTITQLNPDSLMDTRVRLAIAVQISSTTGAVQLAGTEAATYTVKNLTTDRVIKADGKLNIAGTFVSDFMTKNLEYIPILGQIPLIKYLFSHETQQPASKISILFVSVRMIPSGF